MRRLKLITDFQIDFTLNKEEETAEKQHFVFEKFKIILRKHSIHLPEIVVDESYLMYY